MKRITTFLAVLALATTASFGQMADGRICPDFTGVDINGNSWHLYELLDAGKTVFVDVSATWCGPCWGYHNTGALEGLYNQHGPTGTTSQDVMVFFVEGDGATTLADLQGTGTNTQGNWTTGTPYPIIDDASIANLLEIAYFPTIYRICPNRIIVEAGQATTANLYAGVGQCESANGANNPMVVDGEVVLNTDVYCSSDSRTFAAKMMNMGTSPLTSATVTVSLNGAAVQTINWTGNLATYGVANLSLNDVVIDGEAADNTISLEISNPNGGTDTDPSNNDLSRSMTKAPEVVANTLTVSITTDQYGGELYWQMQDGDGGIVASGGNATVGINGGGQFATPPADPGAYGNSTTINVDVPTSLTYLDFECMTVTVVDGYGDGICCAYGTGSFSVKNGTETLFSVGDYATGTAQKLGVMSQTAVSTDDIAGLNGMKVFPNPADGIINVDFKLASAAGLTFDLYNAVGQRMSNVGGGQFAAGSHLLPINTANLVEGAYFIVVRDEKNTGSIRFTVVR